MASQAPYNGPTRKLVLAFDVGTTFSGISYCILDPGEIPIIAGVNRYPAQANVGGDAKIPTIVYYSPDGKARAFGAEALTPSIVEQAEEEDWKKVEWFKLHLRPKCMGSSVDGTKLPKLPFGKTVGEIFADFFGYLFRCAKQYIVEITALGALFWESLGDSIEFVLTHPNGWGGPQHTRMRRSAIDAGLIPDTRKGRARIRFVAEGEASLHFCLRKGIMGDAIQPGTKLMIADAGGGTIDITSYTVISDAPFKVEETAVLACQTQGSIFVSRRLHAYLTNFLCASKYGSPADVDFITDVFDKTTKRVFVDQAEPSYIKFGRPIEKDLKVGIRHGSLRLDGAMVASFFESSLWNTVSAIEQQAGPVTSRPRTVVFLVGGFAASPWFFCELQRRLVPSGLSVCHPDSNTNKAVADGAICLYLDRLETDGVAKATLGAFMNILYSKKKAQHKKRRRSVVTDIAGELRLPRHFAPILHKGEKVSETNTYRRSFIRQSTDLMSFKSLGSTVYSYTGDGSPPVWIDEDPEHFIEYCRIMADLSKCALRRVGHDGTPYYQAAYYVAIQFRQTETRAFLEWEENGVRKRGPDSVTYNDDILAGLDVLELDDSEE